MSILRTYAGVIARQALVICVAAAAILTTRAGTAQNVQHISAIVNDEVVSAYDVELRLRLILASSRVADTPENRRQMRPQVIRLLVDEKLQLQEARRLNVKLTAAEIEGAVSRLAEQNKVPVEDLEPMLAAQNVSFGTVLARLRADLAWRKLVRGRFVRSIQISDEDIDDVITRLNANKGKPEHLMSEIFLAVNSPEEDEDVFRNADRLRKEIQEGALFEAVARQFSQAATSEGGGAVGWVQPGEAAAEIQTVLNTLEVGAVSEPVRAEGGIYLIKLHDRRKILVDEPFDAIVALKQILFPLTPEASPENIEAQRQRGAAIANTVRGCDNFEAAAKELGTAGSGDLGRVRIGDLPSEIRDGVVNLEIGQPSAPLQRPTGIHVLMVCDRSAKRSTIPGRDEIREGLMQQRLALMARRWLRDLRRDATIELR
jgi:peptidyl-prolyl cis-trans isomerase SurA